MQATIDQELAAAKAEFETRFWNPTTGRNRFCDGIGGITGRHGTIFGLFKPVLPPDAICLESFFAQGIAMELGLPDLINLSHAQIHLNNVLDKFLRFREAAGNILGAPLMLDPQFNDFVWQHTTEVSDVLPGTAYMAASAAVRIGQKTGDSGLVAKALKIGEGIAYQTYTIENNGYAFDARRLHRGFRRTLPFPGTHAGPLGLVAARRGCPDSAEARVLTATAVTGPLRSCSRPLWSPHCRASRQMAS